MYIVIVAQVTIYLDKALAAQVKQQGMPVSEICQRALRRELADRRRSTQTVPIVGQLTIDTNRRQQ